MKSNKRMKFWISTAKLFSEISFLTLVLYSPSILAWDSDIVHPILSEAATKTPTLSSQYLRKNLGIYDGMKEVISGKKLFEWVLDGSRSEDKIPRFLNHFHNPIHPIESWSIAGLDDFWFSGLSSVLWAQANVTQDGSGGGDWSWIRTRKYYYDSLTSADPMEREESFSKALLGLGHQIHLIQDMAVPAHVRNDAHPLSYNNGGAPIIEKWTAENRATVKNIAGAIKMESDVPLNQSTMFNGVALSPIARLSDNDQYDGSNPSTSSSIGLAEYTNANFFSDDTIFTENADIGDPHGFPFPRAASTDLQSYIDTNKLPKTTIAKDGEEDLGFWIEKTGDGEKITHFAKPTYFTHEVSPETHPKLYHRLFYLDEACYQDYAEKLIPRAIGYSSALLDYFFRGQLSVSAIPYFTDNFLKYITLNIENVTETQEALSEGNFFLLFRYTPVDGNPDGGDDIFLRAEQTPPVGELAYNDSLELSFTSSEVIPIECWDTVTCTLTFLGTLGSETHAVVGKVFNPGKILFNEEWDKGIDGNNHWQYGGDNDGWSTKAVVEGHLIMESTRKPEHDEDGRLNELHMDFAADGSDGLLITPTTHMQFLLPEMSSTVADERHANHALVMYFNDGTIIEYSGDGRLCDWTDPDLLIPLKVDVNKIITDNITERFESANVQIPDPLYLLNIQFMQLAYFDTLNDYWFYMDVDAIRLFDTLREE